MRNRKIKDNMSGFRPEQLKGWSCHLLKFRRQSRSSSFGGKDFLGQSKFGIPVGHLSGDIKEAIKYASQ